MHITIIGMGLIGTSLGMALRTAPPAARKLPAAPHITGYDANPHACRRARERLAIDTVAATLPAAVAQAQLVVLAVPVLTVRVLLHELAPLLPAGAVVTDVASTKAAVCAWAHDLLPAHVDFVGGHPMAGREQSGPDAADAALFRGARYCLTPTPDTRAPALHLVTAMVETLGARLSFIDPDKHDAYVAGISHLPFLLSTMLIEVTAASPDWNAMAPLAASGFRDISRLASGDPQMHRDICLTNQATIVRWINDAVACLLAIREHLEAQDAAALDALFVHARNIREAWLQQQLPPAS